MYKQTEEYSCGPSSYMEEFCLIKNKNKELELHKKGRIKPSRIFLGVSFLELKKDLNLYTENMELTNGIIRRVYNKEIPNFKKEIKSYYLSLINKHKNNIHTIKGDPAIIINILKKVFEKKKKAILLIHSAHWLKEGDLHWIVLKEIRKDGRFLFGDPYLGRIITFSENDLITQLRLVKVDDVPLQIVTDLKI